ncbi:UNVERIFIED_CONTAM: hypothetical protein K2H54_033944 [Gekko kuhli]
MDCLLLFLWTLPVAIGNGTSMPALTLFWLGSVAKTLQLCGISWVSFASAFTGDSSSSSSIRGFNHAACSFGDQPAERPELLPLINTTGRKVKGA